MTTAAADISTEKKKTQARKKQEREKIESRELNLSYGLRRVARFKFSVFPCPRYGKPGQTLHCIDIITVEVESSIRELR